MFWKIVLLDFPKVKGISQLPQLGTAPWIALPPVTRVREPASCRSSCCSGESWAPQPGLGSRALTSYGVFLPQSCLHHTPLRNQHLPGYSGLKIAEISLSSCPALSLRFLFFRKPDTEEVRIEGPDLHQIWCLQLLIPIFRCKLRIFYQVSLSLEVHLMVGLTLKISVYTEVFRKLLFSDSP